MEPLDLHHEEVRAQFPDLKLENLLEELHAVDESGRVFVAPEQSTKYCDGSGGSKATSRTCGTSRAMRGLADRQYKRIAASRYGRDSRGRLKDQALQEP